MTLEVWGVLGTDASPGRESKEDLIASQGKLLQYTAELLGRRKIDQTAISSRAPEPSKLRKSLSPRTIGQYENNQPYMIEAGISRASNISLQRYKGRGRERVRDWNAHQTC